MRDPSQGGLSAGFDSAQPAPLEGLAALAAHCWQWCQGWRPDLWPAYAALHEVQDWHALAEAMEAVRDAQTAA